MSTILPFASTETRPNYLNVDYGWKSWLFTTDHKRIALLYLFSITAFFFVGGAFAVGMRINLLTPEGLFSHDTYNKLFTMHGIIMVFFFLVPSIPATLGNFLVPLMIGARDLAFPRINLLSWYIYIVGGIIALTAVVEGGVDTGWTFYAPFSSTYSNTHVILAALGVFVSGFSSILTGLNFIVTIHKMRAPGMTWGRLPLFVWGHYATSLIQVLGTPVIAITMVLLGLERVLHAGHLRSDRGRRPGAVSAPVLVLLAPGGLHHDSAGHGGDQRNRNVLFAQSDLRLQLRGVLQHRHRGAGIPGLGTSFVCRRAIDVRQHGVLLSSVFWWRFRRRSRCSIGRRRCTRVRSPIETPMLYAFGFIGLFTIGGLTGLFLATMAIDVHVTDTYFVIAHFHYVMVGGMVMAYLGGIHFWFPKITGRLYPEGWAKFAALVVFVGFNLTFFPAVHSRVPGNAAALRALSAGISGVECDVDGGRLHSGRRLSDPDDLPDLGLAERARFRRRIHGTRRVSNGSNRPRRRPHSISMHPPVVTEPAYNYSGQEKEVEIGG